MALWIDPVFDRTEQDVAFAKEQIQKWIEQTLAGNLSETYELKGCLNLSDINRIEGNIQYLSDELDRLLYEPGVSCKVWEKSGMPTERDIRRILTNVRLLIASFYQQEGTSEVPDKMALHTDINAIEENLYNLKTLLDSMVDGFSKSGTYQSGGMRLLPIRR